MRTSLTVYLLKQTFYLMVMIRFMIIK